MISQEELIELIEGLTAGELDRFVEAGLVMPMGEPAQRRFEAVDVARIRLIRELRIDLSVGEDALPVVLSLLDQVHALRYRLTCLMRSIETLPEEQRAALAQALMAHLSAGAPGRPL